MKPRPRHTVLALDLGGVLFDIDLQRYQRGMSQAFAVEAHELGEATFSSGAWGRADRGELDGVGFAREVLDRLHVEDNGESRARFRSAWCSVLKLRVGAAELVRTLRVRAVAWSNTDPVHAAVLREDPALASLFDLVFSCDIGVEKPCPHFYQRALEKIGRAPEAIVYADDRRCNVAAARALGIDAFVVASLAALRTGLVQRSLLRP